MEIEIRSADYAIVRGYVNVVDRYSRPLRGYGKTFVEKVKPGVFSNAINQAENEHRAIEMLIDHNSNIKVCDTVNGGLELREDNVGLFIDSTITDPVIIREIREHKPKGWSFGFVKQKDKFEKVEGQDIEERTLEEIELREVSLLINKYPAYMATSVEVRADEEIELEFRGYEDINIIDKIEPEKRGFNDVYSKKVKVMKMMSEVTRG